MNAAAETRKVGEALQLSAPRREWSRAWWAARALWNELARFRFDYPVAASTTAGAKGLLDYYVYSDRLFFESMALDPGGVPRQLNRLVGETYNPAYVAWYGLTSQERCLRGIDAGGRDEFLRQVAWLADNAVRRPDGSVVWFLNHDWQEGDCFFKAPWISAMSQGLAMSALVRGHRVSRDAALLQLARGATVVFARDVGEGGVRTREHGITLYEEYPGYPLPRILDGFLFGLLGLHDVFVETDDPAIGAMFEAGVAGLEATLPFWSYRDKWSWYGAHGYLCPPHYHRLNAALLESVARVSGRSLIGNYAGAWDTRRLGALSRIEVYLVFLATKNRCRLRNLRKAFAR